MQTSLLATVNISIAAEQPIEQQAQIGVYSNPYLMTDVPVRLKSPYLIDSMPSSLTLALSKVYGGITDNAVLRAQFAKAEAHTTMRIAFVIHKGLPSQPTVYNVAFHPVVNQWLGQREYNQTIAAGIFEPNGVQAAADQSISLGSLQPLAVNPHGSDMYSPNNGRFAVTKGRAIVSFWLAGLLKDHVAISYNLLILDPGLYKQLDELATKLNEQYRAEDQLNELSKGLGSLADKLQNKQDTLAVQQSGTILATVAKQANAEQTRLEQARLEQIRLEQTRLAKRLIKHAIEVTSSSMNHELSLLQLQLQNLSLLS